MRSIFSIASLALSLFSEAASKAIPPSLGDLAADVGLYPDSVLSPKAALNTNRSQAGTDLVQWDGYSLFVEGQRVFIQGGEFHTWRLPVVDLWQDIMEKFKAAGLNAVSIYVHWGLTNPNENETYWDGYKALQPFFDAAKAAGVWVIVRPGPYINAETTAGGMPGWVTNIEDHLRTNESTYAASWQRYIKEVSEVTAKNQITEGGPVILVQVENEYVTDANSGSPTGKDGYMQDVQDAFRANGIVVPLTYNDVGGGGNFASGLGSVDIYGFDSYPQGFDCSNPKVWRGVSQSYYRDHMRWSPSVPFYIPEFQGGSFDPWGPNAPGYEKCAILTGADFASVFYKNNWASRERKDGKLLHVLWGTTHGYLAFPGVYTSYDYGAAISENRALTEKYTEVKRQSLFLRSSRDFPMTDRLATSDSKNYSSSAAVYATELRNPETNAGFYVVRSRNSAGLDPVSFSLNVETSAGSITIPVQAPSIDLNARESRVIVTDYKSGSIDLLYSTGSVLLGTKIGSKDVLYLFGNSNSTSEASIKSPIDGLKFSGAFDAATTTTGDYTVVTWTPNSDGIAVASTADAVIILSNTDAAGKIWNPVIASSSGSTFFSTGTNETVLVSGPYLVRDAAISGSTLNLRGDLKEDVSAFVYASDSISSIAWNGKDTQATKNPEGFWTFKLSPSIPTIPSPSFGEWKMIDGLPELAADYDDGNWTVADKTSTTNPYKPYSGEYVLYACEYGFCNGATLWRGSFEASESSKPTAIDLSIVGGWATAGSIFINGIYSGWVDWETNRTYSFPAGSVKTGTNVLTVVHDNMGMDQTDYGSWNADTSKRPRGIKGYSLVGGSNSSISWKVQGQQGGYSKVPDTLRGITNEAGFSPVRAGLHLPGVSTAEWETSSPITDGVPGAGIRFYRTEVKLDLPKGFDVMMSLNFANERGDWRADVWVNGWQMARRLSNRGPQIRFPLHEGILDYSGTNSIALSLWSPSATGAKIGSLSLDVDFVLEGGLAKIASDNPGIDARRF